MRRPLLATAVALALLLTTGGWAVAQETSPEPSVSPDPAVSPDPGMTPTPEQLAEAEERLATATCLGKPATIVAIAGFETVGTPGADVIVGTDGDDIIRGEGGNDRICAGPGADLVEGGAGADRIDGGPGDDEIDGGPSNDTISGGPGADAVLGSAGNDRLLGNGGDDRLDGGRGKDVCIGGPGVNRLPACNERNATRGTLHIEKPGTHRLKGPHRGNIVVHEHDVRLDCGGHSLIGRGIRNKRVDHGIGIRILPDPQRVTITNCHPTNFAVGMEAGGGSTKRIVIRNSSANRNGEGFRIYALRTTLTDNEASRNDTVGFSLPGIRSAKILRNVANDNFQSGFGVWFAKGNVIRDNHASGNNRNIELGSSDKNRFAGNVLHDGDFVVMDSDRNSFWGNVLTDAGFSLNNSSRNMFANNEVTRTGVGYHLFFGSTGNEFTANSVADSALGFLDDSAEGAGASGTHNAYEGNNCPGNDRGSDPPGLCSQLVAPPPEE